MEVDLDETTKKAIIKNYRNRESFLEFLVRSNKKVVFFSKKSWYVFFLHKKYPGINALRESFSQKLKNGPPLQFCAKGYAI